MMTTNEDGTREKSTRWPLFAPEPLLSCAPADAFGRIRVGVSSEKFSGWMIPPPLLLGHLSLRHRLSLFGVPDEGLQRQWPR